MVDILDELTVTAVRPVSRGRQPRSLVRVGAGLSPGSVISGIENWTVTNNSFYEADTFDLALAVDKLPAAYDINWFSRQTETFIEILAGFPTNPERPAVSELTSLIFGRIDDLDFDLRTRTLTLKGRDLTGALIDTKVSSEYTNQKASAIVTSIAHAHGLTPSVRSTKSNAGIYFKQDTMQLAPGRSEWDLISFLAREEGFVALVYGQTLYFGPDQTGSGTTLDLNYQAGAPPKGNFTLLTLTRNQTVSKGITVTVMSGGRFNATVKRSYPTTPRGITPGKSSPFGATTDYYFKIPAGATPIQAEQRAEALYNQIIQHAVKLSTELPADVTTNSQSTVNLTGTGTAWDQAYFPRIVTRSMSEDGFSMTIQAQNASPNLTPVSIPDSDTTDADE